MRTASALAWVLLPGLLWAAPAEPAKTEPPASPVEKLRKDLDQPITLKIDKQPLSAALDAFRQKTKINIVIDSLTIQQQLGFTPDQPPVPVQVDLKDVKARSALRAILTPYGLSYAAIGDTVVVTTEDMAAMRQMRQRVSMDLGKVELAAALRQIGRDTGVNLILDSRADKEAKTEVSLQVEDVPLETAVRLLSEMAGLKPVRVGNTLFVTRKEIANDMRNDPDFAQQGQPVAGPYSISTVGPQGAVFFTNTAVGPGQFVTVPQPAPNLPPQAPPAVGPGSAPPAGGAAPAPPGSGGTTPPPAP